MEAKRIKEIADLAQKKLSTTQSVSDALSGSLDGLSFHVMRMVEAPNMDFSCQDMPGDGIVLEIESSVAPVDEIIKEFVRSGRRLTFREFKKLCV